MPNGWTARTAFLAQEKEFVSGLRDELSRLRRTLPWEKVEQHYTFEAASGKVTLADLFDGRSQLIVYHFMFGPGSQAGCTGCSYLADHFDGALMHLANRDTTLAVVSRAPLAEILPFKQRMGWNFQWVSSFGSDFNFDYHVSFTSQQRAGGKVYYNYDTGEFPNEEAPGVSVFARNAQGELFHTYSSYARGLDMLVGTYNLLDLVPKGRGEDGSIRPMSWVRHHDSYAEEYFAGIPQKTCCSTGTDS